MQFYVAFGGDPLDAAWLAATLPDRERWLPERSLAPTLHRALDAPPVMAAILSELREVQGGEHGFFLEAPIRLEVDDERVFRAAYLAGLDDAWALPLALEAAFGSERPSIARIRWFFPDARAGQAWVERNAPDPSSERAWLQALAVPDEAAGSAQAARRAAGRPLPGEVPGVIEFLNPE